MNLCRTCKYWACNSNMIGVGTCTSINAQLKIIADEGFRTAQNFGCVDHEEGKCDSRLESDEIHQKLLSDFIEWTK